MYKVTRNLKRPFVENREISTAIKTQTLAPSKDPKRSVETFEESGGGKTTIQLYPFWIPLITKFSSSLI